MIILTLVANAAASKKYISFPQSYNLKNIMYLIDTQKVQVLFTEPEMLSGEIPNVKN